MWFDRGYNPTGITEICGHVGEGVSGGQLALTAVARLKTHDFRDSFPPSPLLLLAVSETLRLLEH